MWRALFLAVGITMCIVGAECLVVEKAVLAATPATYTAGELEGSTVAGREVQPPEWAPWSLLSGGAVILLYSFTIPKRVGN